VRALRHSGALLLATSLACGDPKVAVLEPDLGSDVRVVAFIGDGQPQLESLDGAEAFRRAPGADGVEVWVLGYGKTELDRSFDGFRELEVAGLPAQLSPGFGGDEGCDARDTSSVLRTRFEGGAEPTYTTASWSDWTARLAELQLAPLRFAPPKKVACPETSAFCSAPSGTQPNQALEIPTRRGFANTNSGDGLPSGDVPKSLETWFRTDACIARSTVAGFGDAAPQRSFQIELCENDELTIRGGDIDWRTQVPSGRYTDGSWHHVAVTYDGTSTIVYLDGDRAASNDSVRFDTRPSRVVIGDDIALGGRPFGGGIDEVRIWSLALTQDEIRERMHLVVAEDTVGLVGAWGFDGGFVDQVVDRSPSKNLAVLRDEARRSDDAPPLGTSAATRQVGAARVVSFGEVGVQLNLSSLSGPTTIAATRLGPAVSGVPPEVVAYAASHWLIRVFDGVTATGDLTLTVDRVEPNDRETPGQLQLLQRDATSRDAWTVAASANSAGAKTMGFVGISRFGQWLVGSTGTPSCCLASCVGN